MPKNSGISVDQGGRILLFGRPVGVLRRDKATVDSACHILELNRFLMARCKSVCFESGLAKKLEDELTRETAHLVRRARVWQLKSDTDPALRFIGYQDLLTRRTGVDPGDYIVVFDGDIGSADPETVYRLLRDHPPSEYSGHALTRSDVLELYNPLQSLFFYIDTFALVPITFTKERTE